jgi:ubiquinone/menaquinone biosynthesis C-methylase UbiE
MVEKPKYFRKLFISWWLPRAYDLWIWVAVLGRTKKLRENILKFIPQNPRVVIDLACGTGENALLLKRSCPEARVLASDLSEGMLSMAQRKAKKEKLAIEFSIQDAARTTYPVGMADCVTITFALHDLPRAQREEVLKEAWRILKPGGTFIVYDYHNPSNFFIRIPLYIQFFLVENRDAWDALSEDLREMFSQAGFTGTKRAVFYKGLAQIVSGKKQAGGT